MDFNHIRQPKKRAFLSAYAVTGNISRAAAAAGITRQTHHNWLKAGNGYAAAFAQAGEIACDALEAEALRRAVEGDEVRHYDKDGNLLWTEVKRSDTLLIFLMKGAMPQKYRENQRLELTGPDGGAIIVGGRLINGGPNGDSDN